MDSLIDIKESMDCSMSVPPSHGMNGRQSCYDSRWRWRRKISGQLTHVHYMAIKTTSAYVA